MSENKRVTANDLQDAANVLDAYARTDPDDVWSAPALRVCDWLWREVDRRDRRAVGRRVEEDKRDE